MAITQLQNQLIGKGMVYPIILNDQGRPDLKTGITLIRSSILIILTWPLYTRYFLKAFGSRLYDLHDEPNDQLLKSLIKRFVVDALGNWERRINLIAVEITRESFDSVTIQLTYRIIDSQETDTFTFPFYREITQ